MSEYKCILCGGVMKVSERGYRCTDENCKMYYYLLPSEVIKIMNDKREMLDVFLDDRDAIIRERDYAINGMKYWKDQAFVARIERDEARQVARRMKTERDNARAMYEVLKMVLEQ